jgi:sulfur-oxidizing protein SoxY
MISENPTLTMEVRGHPHTVLWLHDNNGNEFEAGL